MIAASCSRSSQPSGTPTPVSCSASVSVAACSGASGSPNGSALLGQRLTVRFVVEQRVEAPLAGGGLGDEDLRLVNRLDLVDGGLEGSPAGGEGLDVGDRADEERLVPGVVAEVVLDPVQLHAAEARPPSLAIFVAPVRSVEGFEAASRGLEPGREIPVELLDLRAQLEELVLEPTLLLALVIVETAALDRGAAVGARDVPGLGQGEHVVSTENVGFPSQNLS
jgi:hypothetical protein